MSKMDEKAEASDDMANSMVMGNVLQEDMPAPRIHYLVECYDSNRKLKWAENVGNLVMTGGRNDNLDKYFAGSGYTAAWHVGLIDNAGYTAIAAGDTMASHAGWSEATPYSNAARLLVAWAAAANGIKAASTYVEFTLNATASIRGAFLTSVNTKGGTTGILYSASAFPTVREVQSGDFLRVTPSMQLT